SPESISILVFDPEHSEEVPYAVLTGDTLFIGDVGRPDLRASLGWSAEQLGSMLYDSLHEKLLPLPDETLVYPTHGAGSLCGKNLSTDTVSTIGVQRRYNYALQPMSRERFIEIVTTDQPDTPAYFTYDAVLNARERPTLDERTAREWNDAHVDGALHMPLAHLRERLGEVPAERSLVVYCASGYRSSIATSLLRREGLSQVANLVGGLGAWQSAQLATVA